MLSLPLFPWELSNWLILCAVVGTLKGYDQLMNLVLDDVKENLRGTHPDTFSL